MLDHVGNNRNGECGFSFQRSSSVRHFVFPGPHLSHHQLLRPDGEARKNETVPAEVPESISKGAQKEMLGYVRKSLEKFPKS